MAGGDPISGVFDYENFDISRYPHLRQQIGGGQQRSSGFDSFLSDLKKRRDQRNKAAELAPKLEAGIFDQPDQPGDFRRVESEQAAQQEQETPFQTYEEAEAYLSDYEKQLTDAEARYEAAREQTLAAYREGGLDAGTFIERFEKVFKPTHTELASSRERLKNARDQLAEAKAKAAEAAEASAEEPGAFESAVGWVIDKLEAPMEMFAGHASLAAEGAAQLTGEPTQFTPFNDLTEIIPNPIPGVGSADEDSVLRQRGRQYLEQVKGTMGHVSDETVGHADPVIDVALGRPVTQLAIDTIAGEDAWKPPEAEDIRHFGWDVGIETMHDPTMMVDIGAPVTQAMGKTYRALKSRKFAQELIAKHPKIALAPERFWLRLNGKHKAAMVLNDPQMERVYVADSVKGSEMGYEYGKLRAEMLRHEAQIIEPLNEVQRKQLLEELPLVEKGKDARMAMRETVEPEDIYQRALLDAADLYDDVAARKLALDQKYGLGTKKVEGPYEYFARKRSDEVEAWIKANPKAEKILREVDAEASRKAFQQGWADFEKARKFRKEDFFEAERIMLKRMRDEAGMPETITEFWSRDAFGNMAKDIDKAEQAAKFRNVNMAYVEAFGKNSAEDADLLGAIVGDMADERVARAWANAQKAELRAGELESAMAEFREGRKAVRSAAKAAEREAGRAGRPDVSEMVRSMRRDLELRGDPGNLVGPKVDALEAASTPQEMRSALRALAEDISAFQPDVQTQWYDDFLQGADDWSRSKGRAEGVADLLGKVREEAGEVRFAQKAGQQMARVSPTEGEHVLRTFADEAKERIRDMVAKGGFKRGVVRRAKKLADKYVNDIQRIQDEWWAAHPEAMFPRDAKKYAKGTGAAYRRAVGQFATELKKLAPADLKREFDRMAKRIVKQLDKLETAKAAVSKPVAGAVSQSAKRARKKAIEAFDKAMNSSPHEWSVDLKARYVEAQAAKWGVKPPDPKAMTALQAMREAKVALPEDLQDLARLATTYLSPEDTKTFNRYLKNFYWQHADTPSKFGKWYDGVKAIWQRSTLARVASLTKDFIGTTAQGFIAGNLPELERARAALGGNPVTWSKGARAYKVSDDVLRLQAEGVLQTTKGEALQRGYFEGANLLGKAAKRVEERGVVGAALPNVLGGKKVTEATDAVLHARVWWEQVNRLATYRKAIKRGASHAEAVEDVYKYWGKFDEMSKLDRVLLNRIFFFYSWMRASIPITMRAILDHPVRSRYLLTAMAGDVHDDNNMPEWIRRMGGVALGQDDMGNATVASTGSSTYFSPTFSLLQSDMVEAARKGEPLEAGSSLLRETFRSSPPFVQSLAELGSKRDYFTNRDWWDENGNQQTRAPIGFYWFTSEREPTAVQKVLNLTPVTDKDGKLKYVTMDPWWAWAFGGGPGVEPVMQDLSSFVDPRMEDMPYRFDTGEKGVGFSLQKGLARQAGIPVYSVPLEDDQQKAIRELNKAIGDDLKRLTGGALYRTPSGDFVPSNRTERGRALAYDLEKWTNEGKEQGKTGYALKVYVEDRLKRHYQNEWRIMELGRRVQYLKAIADGELPGAISRADFGLKPKKNTRYEKQGEREAKRRLSALGLR